MWTLPGSEMGYFGKYLARPFFGGYFGSSGLASTEPVVASTDLLKFCKTMSGLPAVNEEMDDPQWYLLLSLAQKELFRILATHAPSSQYGPPVKLSSLDGGYTYTLPAVPWGRAEIRESRTGALLIPGADYNPMADFTIEGATLRWVSGKQRTFPDGPYARFASEPGGIDEAHAPALWPPSSHIYIAWRALEMWASQGRLRDPSFYQRELQKGLWGDPTQPGHLGLVPLLKMQYLNQQEADVMTTFVPYWRSPDLINPLVG